MKSLNGLLFIVAGGAIIWIGATGRLPALAAALGMIKSSPGNTGGTVAPSQNAFSVAGTQNTMQTTTSAPLTTQGGSTVSALPPDQAWMQGLYNMGWLSK
jgi:hypothetical protein